MMPGRRVGRGVSHDITEQGIRVEEVEVDICYKIQRSAHPDGGIPTPELL